MSPRRQTEGAIYVEFLIAFMPLLVFFMSLVQLACLEAASIVVQHAAVMGARAAIVVLPDDEQFYGGEPPNHATGKRLTDIKRAAEAPLRAVAPAPSVTLTFPSSESGTDNRTSFDIYDLVRVRVELDYECRIPIGRSVVCGLQDGTRKLVGYAALPNQGAGYSYGGGE